MLLLMKEKRRGSSGQVALKVPETSGQIGEPKEEHEEEAGNQW